MSRDPDRDGVFAGQRPGRAIIDIGSNTVRLVVYGGAPRAPTVLLNEKVTARLGAGLADGGAMGEENMAAALRGLARFALLLDELGVERVETVATAAVRDAANGPAFLDKVRALGLAPRLLAGEEEARISASGVAGAFPGARGAVADLGGGSLELARLDKQGRCRDRVSLPLGTLRLAERVADGRGELRAWVRAMLGKTGWAREGARPLYMVGGTWRALAVLAMQERDWPLTDPHGFVLKADEARAMAKRVRDAEPETLAAMPRISSMRAEHLPNAAILLLAMLDTLRPERLVFSSWGLREGLLYEGLEPHARTQDPLLAGVANFADRRGAPPILGTRVASWTIGALPPGGGGAERVRLAATMLALASMQIEPNLRVRLGIDWGLHKRWIGADAADRAMMAATILANGNRCDLPGELEKLASRALLDEAIAWGLAVRLARRLGARSRRSLQASSISRVKGRLVLRLEKRIAPLYGQPTEKDMANLAERLELEPAVEIVPELATLKADAAA